MADAASTLFWSLAITQPSLLVADQVDNIPLDADSVEGLATVAQTLGTGISGQTVNGLLLTSLSDAAGALKRLTAGKRDEMGARAELVKLGYLLGQVPPKDLADASRTLVRSGLAVFASATEMRKKARAALAPTSATGKVDPLYLCMDELELSVRTANILQNAKISFVGELVQKSEDELLKIKYLHRKALKEIKQILAEMGLSLGTRLSPEQFDLAKAEAAWEDRRRRSVNHC